MQMPQRLSPRDLEFLTGETPSTPRHIGTLEIFDAGLTYDDLRALVEERIAFVPRYRQRLREVPGRLANPVWIDDVGFDLGFHVRRAALPSPGGPVQLRDLVSRIMSRRLDRHRPLWELYLIEGLEGGRVAVLSKSHQVLVDGITTVDLGQVLLDSRPEPRELGPDAWAPHRAPSPLGVVAGAVRESLTRPATLVATGHSRAHGVLRAGGAVSHRAGAVANALANRRPARESPVSAELSEQRRLVTVRTCLEDYRTVRRAHGGSVNDVVLATITGALRAWLTARGTPPSQMRHLRAMVPMSVIDEELEPTSLGTQVAGHLLQLPLAEASPVIRLHQVSYAFKAHRETGRAVAANRLVGIAGFAPTTFHALGARVAAGNAHRTFHLTITNVPGPQFPLYAAGVEMQETYPVQPLLPGQALAIGVTSYNGGVHYGITADHDALPDVTLFAQCVKDSLEELVESTDDARRAPRGRGETVGSPPGLDP